MATSLNPAGERFAASLISQGKINRSASWDWNAADEDALLGKDGDQWDNLGKHFLGIHPGTDPKTKAHWAYPFAKGDTVYRSGLTAIRQRAGQQGASSVFDAAGKLLAKIDKDDKKGAAAAITLQFSAIPLPGETPEQPTGVQGIAYAGGVIPGYGAMGDAIIDLANVQFSPAVFLLVNHDVNQRAGKATLAVDNNRLLVHGQFSQATPTGKQIAAEFAEEMPFQFSVGIQSDLEYSPDKRECLVNGQMVSVNSVFSNVRVLEVSLVPAGADLHTSATAFSAVTDSLFQTYEDEPMATPDEIRLAAEVDALKTENAELREQIKAQRTQEVDALFAALGETPEASQRQQLIDLPADTFEFVAKTLRDAAKLKVPNYLFKPQTAGDSDQSQAKIPTPTTIFEARRKAAAEARKSA